MADPFDQELTPHLFSRVGSYRPDRLRILPKHCDCKWKTDPLPIEESPHVITLSVRLGEDSAMASMKFNEFARKFVRTR
jgi:hypothetical protein